MREPMSDGPSRPEYTAFVERIYHTMEAGFKQINERLDVLNGRTGKSEISDAEIRARVVSLEKEVFREKRSGADRRHDDREAPEEPERVSRRDGAIAAASLTALVIALKVIEILLTKAWTAIAAGGKG